MTPEPSPLVEVTVEATGTSYYIDFPPPWLVLVAVIGVLMVLRRRFPGLTPILIAVLILAVPFVLLTVITVLTGAGSGFED